MSTLGYRLARVPHDAGLFYAGGVKLRCADDQTNEPTHPMTLGTMRRQGVRGLFATCQHCGRETAVNVDAWPDDVALPSFRTAVAVQPVRQARRHRDTELDRASLSA
jgi:hypothetical protein